MDLPRRLIVISPHLDDAVFSCGDLIAACPGARVVTIFAGMPAPDVAAPDWDRAAGFDSGAQAVTARRREDLHALDILGATPTWLDFLDSQYGQSRASGVIAAELACVLDGEDDLTIAAPMGLFHSDHVLANAACMLVRDDMPRQWWFYEDAIYRRLPGKVQGRLAEWWRGKLTATPVALPVQAATERKQRAMRAYASQMRLFNDAQRADIARPERYWELSGQDEPCPAVRADTTQ
jgi:LmbE family N-acetylglucosaminyl deacetylase